MTGLLLAAAAASGTHLLWSAVAMGATAPRPRRRRAVGAALRRSVDHRPGELVAASALLAIISALASYAVLGGVVAALGASVATAGIPLAAHRRRHELGRRRAHDAWPRLVEEIRILTGSLGRSIPQALFDVGARGPVELRPAFEEARREWLLSTDFERTIAVLKAGLADPTADATCETLLVAHDLGGADLDRRLLALAADRGLDVQGRRDARARQAGVRFARQFVLIVPLGMALAGLSIGDGRAAYATAAGQAIVAIAVGAIAACWWWAGRLLRLPDEERVFA